MRRESDSSYFSRQHPEGSFFEKKRSRRDFFGVLGKATLLAMTADTIHGELLRENRGAEGFMVSSPEQAERFSHTCTLAIGGFNVANTNYLADTINDIFPDYGQVGYIENATNSLDIDDIERAATTFLEENDITRLRLYGHSMGGMLAIELGARLKEKIPVLEAIILDCTPADAADVRGVRNAGTWLLHASDMANLHLGPAARTAFETISPVVSGDDDIMSACLNALRKVSKPDEMCSNRLVQAQASYLRMFDVASFSGSFEDSTTIARLRPERYASDATINNQTSLARFEHGLDHEIIDVPIPGSAHANPSSCREGYAHALNKLARERGFDQFDATIDTSHLPRTPAWYTYKYE